MRAVRRLWVLLAPLLTLAILLAVPGRASAASHALLIGISDYPGELFPRLQGPKNDIPLLHTLLVSRLGVPEQNITTLLDAEATHTGLRKAFAALAERVQPGDFVYIHYSGHGSYTDDLNGDEELGKKDQTWVSYGARIHKFSGDDDYDVIDDEINEWLIPLYKKPVQLVFVSDSCHSATVTRGAVVGVRAAPADPRPNPLGKRVFESTPDPPGVRIGAARDVESATETPIGGKSYGVFTWYWVEALNQVNPGDTWDDVFRRVETLVTSAPNVSQRPQMSGHGEVTVLGGQVTGLKTTVPVTAVDSTARTVRIGVGLVSGVTAGSRYQLASATPPDRSNELPTIEITGVAPFTSEAKLARGELKVGDLLEETEHVYPFQPIRLRVEGDAAGGENKVLIRRLTRMAGELKGFQLVQDRAQADWIVYVLRPERHGNDYVYASKAHTLPKSSPQQPPEAWVVSPQEKLLHERMRVPLKDADKGIAALRENLEKYARVQQVKQLASSGGPPSLQVNVVLLRSDPSCTDCIKLNGPDGREHPYRRLGTVPLDSLPAGPPRLGDVIAFTIKNDDAQQAYYVYLLDLTPDGGVTPFFPTPRMIEEQARIDPGQERDLSRDAGLLLNTPGVELIKLIATREPIDVRLFESADYRLVRGGSLNPLERLLSEAMYTRGQAVSVSRDKWGTLQAEFEVKGPDARQ